MGFKGIFIARTCFPDVYDRYFLDESTVILRDIWSDFDFFVEFYFGISLNNHNPPRVDVKSMAILFVFVPKKDARFRWVNLILTFWKINSALECVKLTSFIFFLSKRERALFKLPV